MRLAVDLRGKDSKKDRKNVEYGSARWGNKADITESPAAEADFVHAREAQVTESAYCRFVFGGIRWCGYAGMFSGPYVVRFLGQRKYPQIKRIEIK